MRLVDLDPRWLVVNGQRIGFLFRSPTEAKFYQSCFFAPTPSREQTAAIEAVMGEDNDHIVQQCKPECGWKCSPAPADADFSTLSVTPSLDGSAGGLWHGFITNGGIVGGL